MTSVSLFKNKPFIYSIFFHVGLLVLLIGFETTQVIQISPETDETPIIEASLILNKAAYKPTPQPLKKVTPIPEVKPEPQSEPEPEPEIVSKNVVAIQEEKKPPKPDKKREKELKKMAERSLEQAFQQENLQNSLQDDLQKNLKEHDLDIKQAAAAVAPQSEINQHMRLIAAKVNRNWRKPLEINTAGLGCLVLIKVLPNGEVADVKILQGSGDLAFDRSTEIAVRKASPLPIPKNELVRAEFKQFEFSFKPGA